MEKYQQCKDFFQHFQVYLLCDSVGWGLFAQEYIHHFPTVNRQTLIGNIIPFSNSYYNWKSFFWKIGEICGQRDREKCEVLRKVEDQEAKLIEISVMQEGSIQIDEDICDARRPFTISVKREENGRMLRILQMTKLFLKQS